jgi:hypothetical protein
MHHRRQKVRNEGEQKQSKISEVGLSVLVYCQRWWQQTVCPVSSSRVPNLRGCLPRIRSSDREWHWRACVQDEGQTDVLLENCLRLTFEVLWYKLKFVMFKTKHVKVLRRRLWTWSFLIVRWILYLRIAYLIRPLRKSRLQWRRWLMYARPCIAVRTEWAGIVKI